MILNYVNFLKKLDNQKSKKLSKKRGTKFSRWLLIVQNHLIERVVKLIKEAKLKGFNHLVLEDLEVISSLRSNNKEFNINNGRLLKLLNLSSLKYKIRKIAYKYGVNVSYIPAEYTSQQCSSCNNIDKNNRKSQEEFCCTSCGFELNADYNSSINIKNRILSNVLKDKLLRFNGFEWDCKKLGHSKVKEILLEFL